MFGMCCKLGTQWIVTYNFLGTYSICLKSEDRTMYSTRPTDDLQSTVLIPSVRILSSKSSTKSSHASILHPNLDPHHPAQCSVRNQTTTSASSRPGRSGWKSSQTFRAMSKTVPKVNPCASRTEAQVALYNLYEPALGC